MRRRALLLAAASLACGAPPPPGAFATSALGAARFAAPLDGATERLYWRELERLAGRARRDVPPTSAGVAATLRSLVFERDGFVREVNDEDLRFSLLPSVLRDRRGSCVGLGSLYLALAEALGVRARGVLRPGHFYVRLEHGGAHANAELLRQGEVMPDDWYRARFPAPPGTERQYGRPLAPEETLGVIEYNVGNQRRRERRVEAARQAFARSVRHFPEFAEAHASLGAALHLLGRDGEAQESYRVAQRLNPELPNLTRNLRLLAP